MSEDNGNVTRANENVEYVALTQAMFRFKYLPFHISDIIAFVCVLRFSKYILKQL